MPSAVPRAVPRALVSWLVAIGLLLAATVAGVLVANSTVFGPASFVRIYLDTLARGDADAVLGMQGVRDDGAQIDDSVLAASITAGLTDLREVSVSSRGDTAVVEFSWAIGSGSSAQAGTTAFEVERTGTRFALFPEWGFARSPLVTVSVDARGDDRFRVNGADDRVGADPVALLVPGLYVFDHQSRLLESPPEPVLATTVGERMDVRVDIAASPEFIALVDDEIHRYLDACATQEVLQPAGCPFGQEITDRIVGTPKWSIDAYPTVTLEPGAASGSWRMPQTDGAAHLTVDVRRIFDGRVRTFDEPVPFTAAFDITLAPDDTATITPSLVE